MKYMLYAKMAIFLFGYFVCFASAYAVPSWDVRAVEGRKAWLKYNCYSCHGMRAAGGMGPRLAGDSDDVAEAVIKGEEEGMPSYKKYKVTAQEMKDMATYLRTIDLSRPNNVDPTLNPSEPYFMHWWESGTPSQ